MKLRLYITTCLCIMLVFIAPSCQKSGSGGGNPGGGGGGGGGSVPTITIQGNSFSANITVKVNTAIKIVNNDAMLHSFTADNMTAFDKDVPAGSFINFTPTATGTFPFHCKYHGGMTGTLTVTP